MNLHARRSRFSTAAAAALVSLLFAALPSVSQARLVSWSGGLQAAGMVTHDRESLSLLSGSIKPGSSVGQDLTVSADGRLYAIARGTVYEYNPVDLTVIRSRAAAGLNGLAAGNGLLYSYSGGLGAARLVTLDAETLAIRSGSLVDANSFGQDLTFDAAGRLFGVNNETIFEYDPLSLRILNSRVIGAGLSGLVARDGLLYSYSGGQAEANLVTFDADTLALRAGTLRVAVSPGHDLAFDTNGRLFGIANDIIHEYNPVTLAVLDSHVVPGDISGLAVIPEPSGAALALLGVGAYLLASRRRRG